MGGAGRMKHSSLALLERSASPILVIRLGDELLVEINEALFLMTGFSREDVLGRPGQELIIPLRPPAPAVALHLLDSLGSIADIPVGLRTRSGELRVAHLSGQAIEVDGQLEALCTLRDARDPTPAERRAAAGEELVRIIRGTGSSDPASAALQAMGECLRWELGALWHLDPVAGRLTCAATWRWPPCQPAGPRGVEAARQPLRRRRAAGPDLAGRPGGMGRRPHRGGRPRERFRGRRGHRRRGGPRLVRLPGGGGR